MKITGGYRTLLCVGGVALLLVALATSLWIWKFRNYTPAEVALDIRAAIASQNHPKPVERYLELRYGSLEEPANRQKAFLDFFNVGHIEGLQVISSGAPESLRKVHMDAMAAWVEQYRAAMTPEEKQALSAQLSTDAGRRMLQQAAAHYLKQDAHYRATTAPVISELMTTMSTLEQP